ncbi:MAG: Hsp70 family protein [Clostridia bacterium]|nr:Hsp70 family protein [Clostridia bacterium]
MQIGIDLGTTYSLAAIFDEKTGQPKIIPDRNGNKITPSVIQILENGEILVGWEAKEACEAGEYGCVSAFKRGMGKEEMYCTFYGKDYTSVELSAILLRYLKEEVEYVTGQTVDEAVVTVPAYFYHKERKATMTAARQAGLNIRQIINEPTAAAIHYGAKHWRENARILVYDLGGGTFDTTLIRMKKDGEMESLQTLGNHTLGGKDWDERLSNLVEEKIEADTGFRTETDRAVRQEIRQGIENVKKQLTQRNTASVRLHLPGIGLYTVNVTRDEFDQRTRDLIERTGDLCSSLLQRCGLQWTDITDILLVGGSTRMRQVPEYLKAISGHTPLAQVHPDEAVALGAAVQVHKPLPEYLVVSSTAAPAADKPYLFRRKKPAASVPETVGAEKQLSNALCVTPMDVVAHAMGVIAVNQEGTHYINKTIIPANQRIPVKYAEAFHYYTSSKSDNELEIYVLQGEKAPLECQIIGKYVVTGIVHDRAANPTIIRIQYSYDVNGMIHVQARQGDAQEDLPIREEPVPEDMSKFGRPVEMESTTVEAEPLTAMLAVDVSGSMSGTPLRDAKNAMCHFVDEVSNYPGQVRVGVIAVSDRSEIVQKPTSNAALCKMNINSIQLGKTGYGNQGQPFNDILSELKDVAGIRLALVLADGVWSRQAHAVRRAHACHAQGIQVTGIGFGSADVKFLQDISCGDYKSMLVSQSELKRSFGKIAQEISGSAGSQKSGRSESTAADTWRATGER